MNRLTIYLKRAFITVAFVFAAGVMLVYEKSGEYTFEWSELKEADNVYPILISSALLGCLAGTAYNTARVFLKFCAWAALAAVFLLATNNTAGTSDFMDPRQIVRAALIGAPLGALLYTIFAPPRPYLRTASIFGCLGLFVTWADDGFDLSDFGDLRAYVGIVLLGGIVGLLLHGLLHALTADLTLESSDSIIPSDVAEPTKAMVRQLRARSSRLKLIARLVLCGNAALLLVGLSIFIYADQVIQTTRDRAFATALYPLARRAVEETLKGCEASVAAGVGAHNPNEMIAPPRQTYSSDTAEPINCKEWRDALARGPRGLLSGLKGVGPESSVADKFDNSFSEHLAPILKQREDELTSAEKSISASIISTLTTRVGIVFLLLFLMQTLVTFYRYNTRLASFYDARADALQLGSEHNKLPLDTLVTSLAGERIDFGKAPVTPLEHVIDLAKTLRGKDKEPKADEES